MKKIESYIIAIKISKFQNKNFEVPVGQHSFVPSYNFF